MRASMATLFYIFTIFLPACRLGSLAARGLTHLAAACLGGQAQAQQQQGG